MIEIRRDCGSGDVRWETIVERTLNTGEYPWKVSGDPTDCARIRVSLANYPTVCDTSDGEFIILKCEAGPAELGFMRRVSDPTRILEIPMSDTPFIFRGTEFVAWADMPSAVTVSLWPINRNSVLADAPFYERVCTPELLHNSSSDKVSWAHISFENEGGEFPVLGSSDVLLRITRIDDNASTQSKTHCGECPVCSIDINSLAAANGSGFGSSGRSGLADGSKLTATTLLRRRSYCPVIRRRSS